MTEDVRKGILEMTGTMEDAMAFVNHVLSREGAELEESMQLLFAVAVDWPEDVVVVMVSRLAAEKDLAKRLYRAGIGTGCCADWTSLFLEKVPEFREKHARTFERLLEMM